VTALEVAEAVAALLSLTASMVRYKQRIGDVASASFEH
jgi:hypothetical protein